MSPKLTIAYESVDASPAPAANPGDRIDAMFEAAEERHRAARRVVSMLMRALVYLGALLTTAVLLFLVGYILVNGVPYLTPSLFEWEYNSTNVSLMPALVNTLLMAALSLLMAVPVGVGSAIYLVEYAPRGSRFVAVVRTTAETLQGIPSIIYGLFGMLFFVTALHWNLSLLAGACTLAIMVLPVVMRTTEEALHMEDLEPVDFRQHDVEQHQLGEALLARGEELARRREARRLESGLLESVHREVADVGIVFNVVDHGLVLSAGSALSPPSSLL